MASPVYAGESEVIYGDDNRHDLFDAANDPRMVELSKSTAALVEKASVVVDARDPEKRKLPADTFGDSFGLCEDEPFRTQPNPAFCSGFLVGPTTFVTAGHCITDEASCGSVAFVFGFGYAAADQDPTTVNVGDVYYCRRIIARQQVGTLGTDYSVVELDRPVTDRPPLAFRRAGTIPAGASVTVVGHPSGLPTKISGGANVRDPMEGQPYFVANLDTYGGNSGSAVFNSETGEVEGILVRGENDFINRDDCRVSNVCTNEGCRGEDVTKATEFAVHVPDPNEPQRPTRKVSYDAGALSLEIPDNNETGVSVDFNVDATEPVANVGLYVQLDHSYVGDLRIEIVHPDGTTVAAFNRGGGSADGLDTTFGLDGTGVVELLQLRGKPAAGTWKVVVKDLANSDTGVVKSLKLNLEVYTD
jgi:subtilisin-like proprotein convertase family protein/V8-like Glu-specific endopeptidase